MNKKTKAGFTPTPESSICKDRAESPQPMHRCVDEWAKNAERPPESHECKPMVWGFTIIELLVVVTISIVISGAGFLGLANFNASQNIKNSLQEVEVALRYAQKRSVTQENGKTWGAHFANTTSSASNFNIFSGTAYSSSTIDRIYNLRKNVSFTNPYTSSTYDAIFTALSGRLSASKVLTIAGSRGGGSIGDIILNSIGRVTTRRDDNLAGYWHLDEGTATTTYDASGLSNTGSSTAVTWASGSNCKAGGCISFNGSSDYIDFGNQGIGSDIDGVSAITVSYWINIAAAPSAGNTFQTVGIVMGSSAGGIDGRINESRKVTFGGRSKSSDNFQNATSTTALSTNTWYHVAGVYNYGNSNISIYINGALDLSQSVTFGNTQYTHSWTSGADQIGNFPSQSRYLNGKLDEIRIYNRALSATEILNQYNDLK